MRLKHWLISACAAAAVVVLATPLRAVAVHECVSAQPTAASYTWNFQNEANAIFQNLESNVELALTSADQLQTWKPDGNLVWESNADQLAQLKTAVNDMSDQLCRLDTIRRAVSPWQQETIDRINADLRLMADNTEDALLFVRSSPDRLWSPTYHQYLDNIHKEATALNRSVKDASAYASVQKRSQELRKELGVKASS